MSDNENQDKPLHGPNLILDVENFGPIAEAKEIEFRPMTVFVGPSNTGKSYLAMLLHAMLEGIPEAAPHRRPFPRGRTETAESATDLLYDVVESAHVKVAAISENARDVPADYEREVTNAAISAIRDILVGEISEAMFRSLRRFYEVGKLIQLGTGGRSPIAEPTIGLRDEFMRISLNSGSEKSFVDGSVLSTDELLMSQMSDLLNPERERLNRFSVARMLSRILSALIEQVELNVSSLYFPAARTGILTSHKVMTDSLIESAHRFFVDDEPRPNIPYHKVARDFLRQVNSVADAGNRGRRSRNQCGYDVAQSLEESVLMGRIEVVSNEYGPPDFEYLPFSFNEMRVPMFKASSAVTELAPIVAFLRSYVSRGDLLIIEEPESHLHPASQQKMAAALALMVRKGLRVLVTTHSHYFVEQMGTFVNASHASPDERAKSMRLLGPDLDRDLYLTEREVAVYDFSRKSDSTGGTVVERLRLDPETYSFNPPGYSASLVDHFNRMSRILDVRMTDEELA